MGIYQDNESVTFQTCITQNGNASWGHLFVIADRIIKRKGMTTFNVLD